MIAIVGKIGAGKTTLVTKLKFLGYKVLVCDDLVTDYYKNNKPLIDEIRVKIGSFLIENNQVSKPKIIEWIMNEKRDDENSESQNIKLLEEIVFRHIFSHFKDNNYDFVEIPILNTNIIDFSIFFTKIINIKISEGERQKNLVLRGVNNSLIKKLVKNNDDFFDKNSVFRSVPVVNISWEKTKNIEEIKKILKLKSNSL